MPTSSSQAQDAAQQLSPVETLPFSDKLPLCVDLDGTLIRSDMLFESLLVMLKKAPWLVFLLPFWLFSGKARLKREIASRVSFDPEALPYHPEFLAWLRAEHQQGRELILATATDIKLAAPIAEHLALFSGVVASDGERNLIGGAKAQRLVELYGEKGFAYAGNDTVDLKVWAHAGEAVVVAAPGPELRQRAEKLSPVTQEFAGSGGALIPAIKALRPHQWVKNILVFLPIFTAHKLHSFDALSKAGLAFVSFSLCASSVYLLNDLLDLESDRHHPRKRNRPFASGKLKLSTGLFMLPVVLASGLGLAAVVGNAFLGILALYFLLTLGYSFHLKQVAVADVIILAALYTIRIFAGATAAQVPLSDWLLVFSLFIFLSLALVKRASELEMLREQQQKSTRGRGYQVGDREIVTSLGSASGYLAVLVLALYITSDDVVALYSHSRRLWGLIPLLLYWISRVWLLTQRGQMHEDPVVFALKDKTSYAVGALTAVVMLIAL